MKLSECLAFRVYRRGKGIVVKGRVPVSERYQKPFLERRGDPRTCVRAFTLAYRVMIPSASDTPTVTALVEIVMPEIGSQVSTILIYRQGGAVVEIKATQPPE